MDGILQWGLDFIVTIQQIQGPVPDSIFQAVSYLGKEEVYLLLLPLLLWCIDFKLGARLAILFLLSIFIGIGLKDLFQQPRPFEIEPSVGLSDAEGYGLPSHHAQSAVIVWGAIAARVHRTWLWVIAIVLMLSIGFSRMYLGVHFPTDVLAGWAIGAFLLAVYLVAASTLERWLIALPLGIQLALGAVVPASLFLLHPVKDVGAAMGALAGAGMGLALMRRYMPLDTRGPWWQRSARLLVGGAVVVGLYLGPKAILPGEGEPFYLAFRFFQYWLVGLWITLGATWLFRILGLTQR